MHQWVKDDSIKVKLMKMSKGYQWEITYENTDDVKLLARLATVDAKLRADYGSVEQ